MAAAANFEYNPFAPGFYEDAFSIYRWMRDEAPVYYSERWGWWALTRFDDVRTAILDTDAFRSFEGMDIDDTEAEQSGPGSLPNMDNPRHDEIRSIVQPWFLPRRVAEHQDKVVGVVRGLISTWRARDEVDLAEELAWPMPFEVFFGFIGLTATDRNDRKTLERWVHELKGREPGSPRLTPTAKAATDGINNYFVDLLEERRRTPRQDLVSHIVQAEINGRPFTDKDIAPTSEVLGLMMVLFLGGVESTAGLTGTLFKLLAENPDQRARVMQDPALIPAAVEEAVRFATPLQLTARTASRAVDLHGVRIPAGARVVLVLGAANRDERQYPNADTFDVTRGLVRNLGFGEGAHGCLGAHLARLETRIAIAEALPVLGDYHLAGPPVFYPSSPNMYVWKNLPVRFDPAG
jgi:cytochrome P450